MRKWARNPTSPEESLNPTLERFQIRKTTRKRRKRAHPITSSPLTPGPAAQYFFTVRLFVYV